MSFNIIGKVRERLNGPVMESNFKKIVDHYVSAASTETWCANAEPFLKARCPRKFDINKPTGDLLQLAAASGFARTSENFLALVRRNYRALPPSILFVISRNSIFRLLLWT